MKKFSFLFTLLIFTGIGFSQKVKIDDNIAYVNGDAFLKFASKSVFDVNVTI